jgi:dTDP-4-dehydrorhamnose reductase
MLEGKRMKILITGSNGLLGQKLVKHCLKSQIPFIATSKGVNRNAFCPSTQYAELDITDDRSIATLFAKERPTHVIHTAAITNVDHCEEQPDLCQSVNVDAVQKLFNACIKIQAHFQLLSTDFVFDGEKGNYDEEDAVHPLSVYAKSKVDAELILINNASKNWSIVRTIIVYGEGENLSRGNIVVWAKETLRAGKSMTIVDDQFRAPTWADDLAWACLRICELNQTGLFHISGPETFSVYELVCRIADHFSCDKSLVTAISSSTLNQAARRPPRTGFNLNKARTILGYNPKSLEETLSLIQ